MRGGTATATMEIGGGGRRTIIAMRQDLNTGSTVGLTQRVDCLDNDMFTSKMTGGGTTVTKVTTGEEPLQAAAPRTVFPIGEWQQGVVATVISGRLHKGAAKATAMYRRLERVAAVT